MTIYWDLSFNVGIFCHETWQDPTNTHDIQPKDVNHPINVGYGWEISMNNELMYECMRCGKNQSTRGSKMFQLSIGLSSPFRNKCKSIKGCI
jgi:hypothetical protein